MYIEMNPTGLTLSDLICVVEQSVQSGKQQAADYYGNNHADHLIQVKFAAFVFCDRLDRGLFSAYPRLDFVEHGSSLK